MEYNQCRTKAMLALEDALVWVKIDHTDRGKPGTVRLKSEEPASYWVEVDGRLLRGSRAHLRVREDKGSTEERSGSSMIAGPTVVGEYQCNREISQESNSKLVSGSSQGTLKSSRGRMIKKKRDPDYVYS